MTQHQRTQLDATLRQGQAVIQDGPVSIEDRRAGFAAFMARMPVPAGTRQEETVLGKRPTLSVTPEGGSRPGTILYFHGGSWVVGSPATALGLTANLVARTGIRALSVDYRLAPEHPFPAAVDDGLAAYRELLERGEEAASIAFAGDSAGGGLAISTCLAARAAGLPQPAAVVAFSPGLDFTMSGDSMTTKAGIDPIFTRDDLVPMKALYLNGQDPKQELLSPAIAGDLTGLPPLLLQAGTNEVLLDDSTRVAERARAAGVDVVLDVVAGVPHVFHAFTDALDEAGAALDRAALFLTQSLKGSPM